MKNHILITLMIISLTVSAQFPAPTNFQFSYHYYHINEDGPCDGQWVYGPTYCSYFNWTAPDTTIISTTLDHYNLYYYDYYIDSTYIIASVTDTFYITEGGFIGEMWIKAVYRNPDGESDSSNVEINTGLPISIMEINPKENIDIIYYSEFKEININNIDRIKEYRISNTQGCELMTGKVNNHTIKVEKLSSGVYIIEIITKDNFTIKKKFII